MAFVFDLSCYTVCFCIILTITRNTWVAVSFLPLALSVCLGLSVSPFSCCRCLIQCAHVWCTMMDWLCMCIHGHLHSWVAWVGRCLWLLLRTVCSGVLCVKCVEDECMLVVFCWGVPDQTLLCSIILSPGPCRHGSYLSTPGNTPRCACCIPTCINGHWKGLNQEFAYKHLGPFSEETANKKCSFTECVTLRSWSNARVAIVTHIIHILAAVIAAMMLIHDVFNTLIHYIRTS